MNKKSTVTFNLVFAGGVIVSVHKARNRRIEYFFIKTVSEKPSSGLQ